MPRTHVSVHLTRQSVCGPRYAVWPHDPKGEGCWRAQEGLPFSAVPLVSILRHREKRSAELLPGQKSVRDLGFSPKP